MSTRNLNRRLRKRQQTTTIITGELRDPFFGAECTMDHLTIPDALRRNVELKYYNAGHMIA